MALRRWPPSCGWRPINCRRPRSRAALEEQGIYYYAARSGTPRASDTVAFVFPGQGSQYAGMLADLVRQHRAAADAVREVDAALCLLGYPCFDEISTDADQLLGVDTLRTQLAMLLADLIVFRTLTSLGIRPAVVTGHSYGELAALVAAGAWSLEQAIGATAARCQAIENGSQPLVSQMLSVAAPADVVRPLVANRTDVYLSHRNAPDQTVLAGEASAVQAIATQLRSSGIESRPLSVPRAFHTPLMAGAQPLFAAALEKVWLAPPQIPLVSSVSLRPAHDPTEIRANLVAQLTAPVDYIALMEQLKHSGVNVLIEVGPQQVLTRLQRRILGDSAVSIASDHPKRSSEQQLCRLLAQLEVAGVARGAAAASRPQAVRAPAPSSDPLASQFVSLDATTRRKAKLREQGAPTPTVRPAEIRPAVTAAAKPATAPIAAAPNGQFTTAPTVAPQPAAAPQVPAQLAPPVAVTPAGTAPAAQNGQRSGSIVRRKKNAPPISELESFLVQFVIDQTGYPPELVGLDADLEADLGIDSIKKAQLFGELREYFDVTPGDDLRLDQFPTLRHVLDFLRGAPGKGDWLDDTPGSGDQPVAPSPAAIPAAVATPPTATGQSAFAAGTTSFAATPAAATATAVEPAPAATWAPATTPELPGVGPRRPRIAVKAKANAPRVEELEVFLIQFVVDQTGYPPEIIKLDADLEADLGIDSIKKAQLFGELTQYFEVSATENLRLDDFPTLGHVLQLLQDALSEQSSAATAVAEPTPANGTAPAPRAVDLQPSVASPPAPASFAAPVIASEAHPATAVLAPVAPAAPAPAAPPLPTQAIAPAVEPSAGLLPELSGLSLDAARQFGETHRQAIRQALRQTAEKATKDSVRAAVPTTTLNPAEMEALRGIAAGAQVAVECLAAQVIGRAKSQPVPASSAPAANGSQSPAAAPPRTQRLVLRMLAAPLPNAVDAAKFEPVGAALVLGDGTVAGALVARLRALGVQVEALSSSHTWPQVRQQFEQAWERQPIRHVFLATAHDPEARLVAGEAAWQRRYERGVLTPYFLCQEWLTRLEDARLCQGATLLAVTALGGDFAFATTPATVEGGAATGLVKSLFIESHYEKWTGLRFKAIDFAGNVAAGEAAEAIFRELASSEKDVEIGYMNGYRHVVRGVELPAGAAQPDAAPRGTWVVTGGARGITAICARLWPAATNCGCI